MLSNSLTLAIKTGRRYWDAKIIIPHVKTKIEQIKKFLSKKMLKSTTGNFVFNSLKIKETKLKKHIILKVQIKLDSNQSALLPSSRIAKALPKKHASNPIHIKSIFLT